jgi:serine/threonine protein kinase
MDPEKWQRVRAVFEKIVDLPSTERSQQLIALTESDGELRAEVESLLEFDSHKQVICSNAIPLEGNTSGAIVGPYRLNFPLAINEKTEVWQAVHQALPEDSDDRKVAIKFFKDLHGDQRRARRFQQEAAILSRFEHPSIARLLEEGTTESGVPWFSTGYVEGTNLLAMADRQNCGLEERLELFDQVCAALEYSHRFLVIHRDVKPDNIVVGEDGKAVLIDFGISKQLEPSLMVADQLTRTFERTLTPAYASPEQLRGEPVSAVTDVYGAGLVLYELVSGHHPYSDTVHQDDKPLFDRILFELPVRPSSVVDGKVTERPRIGVDPRDVRPGQKLTRAKAPSALKLDAGFDEIVLKAIAKFPEHRYQSIAELRRYIAAWRCGEPLTNVGLSGKEASWFQRNAILCSIGACLLGVALTLGLTELISGENSASSNRIDLLENISNSSVDFESLTESDWRDLSPVSKLSLAELATGNQKFGKAVQVATEIDTTQLNVAERLKVARLWSDMGFPERAFDIAGMDRDTFESLVESDPSFESSRRLVCRLHMDVGLPSLAREINNSGSRTSAADRFEREIVENEIREASKWFDGLEARIESTKEQLTNPRIRDRDRRDFADLVLRQCGTEEELKQALLELEDRPGEWSRSKAKLALAITLLNKGAEIEGKTLLMELVKEFEARKLPIHPVVLKSWVVADLFLIDELELIEWWNRHADSLKLGHPLALELFAGVVKRKRDHARHYKTLRPWLAKIDRIENGPAKAAVLRDVWRGAIECDDSEGAAMVVEALTNASEQNIDKNSLEYAEILAILSILDQQRGEQDPETRTDRYRTFQRICNDTIKKHHDNITVSFLKAIDLSSPDSVFKIPRETNSKSVAEWIREFIYHSANRTSDQLEMVAWFSEYHVDTNADDVKRIVIEAINHHDAKRDWGDRGEVNWERIKAVGEKLGLKL